MEPKVLSFILHISQPPLSTVFRDLIYLCSGDEMNVAIQSYSVLLLLNFLPSHGVVFLSNSFTDAKLCSPHAFLFSSKSSQPEQGDRVIIVYLLLHAHCIAIQGWVGK